MTDPGDHPLISWDVESCGEELHQEIWAWVSLSILSTYLLSPHLIA